MSASGIDLSNVPRVRIDRERFDLSCGGTLIVHRRPESPVCALRVHVRGGPSLDPAGREGLAFYTGAFADQGTAEWSDEDIARLLEPEGGGLSGDALGLTGAVTNAAWGTLVDVMGKVVTGAAYPDDRIERHMARMKTRLAVEAEDPRSQGGILFKRLVYGNEHFLGRMHHGTLESASRIDAAALRAHREANWCGERLVIAAVGDFDANEVRDRVERAFASIERGTPHERSEPEFPPIEPRRDAFVRDRNQVHVYLGHLGIRRADPDYEALAVMDHVLGTGPGFTNRITQKLRDQLGLAYTVHADIHASSGLHPGAFRAYIGTSPEHVKTSIDGFLEEMRAIRDVAVPDGELSVAKSYLVGSFATGFERASRRASHLVSAEVHGFPDDHLERLPERFAAVTSEDVQRAAREHLHPDECVLALSGPAVDV